jgi:rubrerythrin
VAVEKEVALGKEAEKEIRRKSDEEIEEEKILKCKICGEPSKEIICPKCKALISGEAIEQKREKEKKGK